MDIFPFFTASQVLPVFSRGYLHSSLQYDLSVFAVSLRVSFGNSCDSVSYVVAVSPLLFLHQITEKNMIDRKYNIFF